MVNIFVIDQTINSVAAQLDVTFTTLRM